MKPILITVAGTLVASGSLLLPNPVLASSRHAAAAVPCKSIPGAAKLLATGKRYIIFGEEHGTVEAPALFGEFVCAAARTGSIVVGLEIDRYDQPDLSTFLASDGGNPAVERLRRSDHFWTNPDGRASQAMLNLVIYLRKLKAAGLPIGVVAFDPGIERGGGPTSREKGIAAAWQNAVSAMHGARLVALTGSFHALRIRDRGSEPAVMHMPQAEVVTLAPAPVGGSSFNCQADGCKVHTAPKEEAVLPGISTPNRATRYDLWYSPGRQFTASPPVNPHVADDVPVPSKEAPRS